MAIYLNYDIQQLDGQKNEGMGKISNIYAALLKTIYIKIFNMNAFS